MSDTPGLPEAPNRHITDNDAAGQSFFSQAIPLPVPVANDLGGAYSRLAYSTLHSPVDMTAGPDIKTYQSTLASENIPLVPEGTASGGTHVWYIDLAPGMESPMHRTKSLDFVVQLVGEVQLTLSDGETRTVRPGDITVQRSTMHRWHNPSKTQFTRMLAVMTECKNVVTESGKVLDTEFLK